MFVWRFTVADKAAFPCSLLVGLCYLVQLSVILMFVCNQNFTLCDLELRKLFSC